MPDPARSGGVKSRRGCRLRPRNRHRRVDRRGCRLRHASRPRGDREAGAGTWRGARRRRQLRRQARPLPFSSEGSFAVKSLVLTLKQEPGQRLDLAPLVPHLLDGKLPKEIAEIEVQTTREKVTAGDIFKSAPAAWTRSVSRVGQRALTTLARI